jgi:cell division protein FtsB
MSKRETRKRLRQVVGPVLAAVVAGYFFYHAAYGERGLGAHAALTEQVREARAELDALRERRLALELGVSLLRPDGLDLDLLEERARAVLNFVDDDDLLIHERGGR